MPGNFHVLWILVYLTLILECGRSSAECMVGHYKESFVGKCENCLLTMNCNDSKYVCQYDCGSPIGYPLCTLRNEICREGYYGLNCSQKCGKCILGMSCNVSSCVCQYGCEDGFRNTLCNETCPSGTWGKQCQNRCGKCNGSSCRHDNGSCETGCVPGFVGDLCTDCRAGYYGLNCSKKCGNCILDMSCNASSGVCQYGCEDGFLPPLCNETCPSGTWGKLCKGVCGNCTTSACHHVNGSCEGGCTPGFIGDLCTVSLDQKCESLENRALIGAIVGSSLFVGISILVAVMIRFRRSRLEQADAGQELEEYIPQYTSSEPALYENSTAGNIPNEENAYEEPKNEKGEIRSYAVLPTIPQDDDEEKQDVQENTYEDTTSVYQNISYNSHP